MKKSVFGKSMGVLAQTIAFAMASAFVVACTGSNDDGGFAGGTTEDAGIIADLNVAGLTQKGPFAKGSAVAVQGIDCKTLKFTDETFEGSVKNDKGEFVVDNVTLSSTCAVFEVSGYYLNELTGKKASEKLTLHALTNLKDRKHVNINVLTELEYERVMNLVTDKKMSFDDAKKQAEEEVLASFNIKGDIAESEDLNILEKGDGNAALLAVSVMVQANANEAKLAERLDEYSVAISQNGSLDDKVKTEIANWATNATATGKLDAIRKNIESWNLTDSVPAFETYVKALANGDSVILSSESRSSSSNVIASEAKQSSSSSVIPASSGNLPSSSSSSDLIFKPIVRADSCKFNGEDNCEYGSLTDKRDGRIYKTVHIGEQWWMAENLKYSAADDVGGYKASACSEYGCFYTWPVTMDSAGIWSSKGVGCNTIDFCTVEIERPVRGICPDGWHVPSKAEWDDLFYAFSDASKYFNHVGLKLKSTSGWRYYIEGEGDGNGTDIYGFTALPAGGYINGSIIGEGEGAYFWASNEHAGNQAYYMGLGPDELAQVTVVDKGGRAYSVRCLKDDGLVAPASSSSSSVIASEAKQSSSSSLALAAACKTETEDNCEYGSLTDDRDGQVYKTVKIGNQVWMAENLNYADSTKTPSLLGRSWCYNDSSKYCEKYGRLYTWAAAIDSVALYDGDYGADCGYGKSCMLPLVKVQGICPNGWHLPETTEWSTLFDEVGGRLTAGKVLKSQTGWYNDGNGIDAVGFTALPGGDRDNYGKFSGAGGCYANFWTATNGSDLEAYYVNMSCSYGDYAHPNDKSGKYYGHSVRCVKD